VTPSERGHKGGQAEARLAGQAIPALERRGGIWPTGVSAHSWYAGFRPLPHSEIRHVQLKKLLSLAAGPAAPVARW
jgi:hypothetical protein